MIWVKCQAAGPALTIARACSADSKMCASIPSSRAASTLLGRSSKKSVASGPATQRVKAMAIDRRIGLRDAKLARPDLDLEFVEPLELAANVGQQIVRHVGEDGDAHSVRLDLARQGKRIGIDAQPHERLHLGDALHLRGPSSTPAASRESLPVLPEVGAAAVIVMASGGIDLEEGRLADADQRRELLQLGIRRREAQHPAVIEDDSIPAA